MARPRGRATSIGDGRAGSSAEQIVERTLNQITPGYKELEARRVRFDAAYDVWRGNTGWNTRVKVNDWQSRLRIKYGMQVVDQALVNLVQGVPRAKVTPRTPDSVGSAGAMEATLGYYADLDHLVEHEPFVCQQALIYGISPGKNCWYYREQMQTAYLPAIDPETGEVEWAPRQGMVVTDDRPAFEPWDAYMIYWDPLARRLEDCAYVVLESYKSRDELEKMRYDDDSKQGRFKNLDLLYADGQGPQPPSTASNRMIEQPIGAYKGKYLISEIWRSTSQGMRLTTLGNRKIMLSDGAGPYWMNGYPITLSNSRPDLHRIEGVSETELIDHIQQALWTVHNLRMEQMKFSVMQGATIRQGVPDIASFVMRPGFQWLVQDHGDVQFHSPPPLQPEAYQEDDHLLSRMQFVTGINPYVTGGSGTAAGVDQNTATGVSLLTENASRLLQFKASIIHQRTWQRTFEQWSALTKQYLRRPQAVRIQVGPDDYIWPKFGPGDLIGEYDIRIEAGDESAQKSQEKADAMTFLQAMTPLILNGIVEPREVIEKVGKSFGITNPEMLLKVVQAATQAAPVQPQQPQLPPMQAGAGLGGPPELSAGSPISRTPALSVLAGNQL